MVDLKSWKKVAEDKHSVEMQHPKGHKITLMLKGVPAIQKEALKRLPLYDGGEIKGVNKSSMEVDRPKNKMEKKWAGESEAGEALRNSDIKPASKEKAKEKHRQTLGEMKAQPKPKIQNFDEGTPDGPIQGDQPQGPSSAPQLAVAQNPAAQSQLSQPINVPVQQNPVDSTQENLQTNPSSDPAQRVAAAYGEQNKTLNNIQASNQTNRNTLDKAYQAYQAYNADPKNAIDSKQYLNNMSLGSKISTGIGLFLGNFSVPFGGKDFTGDFLNKQIQNNIEQQKENYGHQKNVWGAAKDLFGQNQVADNFAHIVALDQVNNLVKQSALQHGTPQAMARGAQMIQQNNIKKEALQNQSAQVLTNHQQQQMQGATNNGASQSAQQPQGWMDKLKSLLPNGGPGAEAGTSNIKSAPVVANRDDALDKNVPDYPIPQFSIDQGKLKNSQFMGSEGVPYQLQPGEIGSANSEVANATAANAKMKIIHNNFATLWKNRSDSNAALKWLSGLGANIGGAHLDLPPMEAQTRPSKEYFRAASNIMNELASLVGSGGLTEQQADSIRNKLIKTNDSPEDYKNVLKQVDNFILSSPQLQTPVLTDKYNVIKRPQIKE